ncbi:hypothetical protein ANO11243_089110 [Dothideomycetidae sp. 11243]|nr:hypothetical protein ANO11243_089110 [fungal sp. No.11243]
MSLSDQIKRTFWDAPPITRALVTASIVLSFPAHLLGIPSVGHLIFWRPYVFTYSRIPQIWRLATSFVLTGPEPPPIHLILDPHFLYRSSKSLETKSLRFSAPGEYFIFLFFVWNVILLLAGWYLGYFAFIHPFIMAMAYLDSVDNPNARAGFLIFTVPNRYSPWVMLALTFVMQSPYHAMVQATGIVAAHLYDFLTRVWPDFGGGRKIISAPVFVQRWFAPPPGVGTPRSYGTSFHQRPAAPAAPSSGSSWASGFNPLAGTSWGNRGPGRRLGGE